MFPLFSLITMYVWFASAFLPAARRVDEGIPHALRSILMIPPGMSLPHSAGVWLYNLIKKYSHVKVAWALAAAFIIFVGIYGY